MKDFELLRSLGSELSSKTKDMKHKFDEKWIENLISFYEVNKGKKLIHISDIQDDLFIKLTAEGKDLLRSRPFSKTDIN